MVTAIVHSGVFLCLVWGAKLGDQPPTRSEDNAVQAYSDTLVCHQV